MQDPGNRSARSAVAGRNRTRGADDAVCLGAELEASLRHGADSLQLPGGGILFVAYRPAISNAACWIVGSVFCPDGGHLDGNWWYCSPRDKGTRSPRGMDRFCGRESCFMRRSPGASGCVAAKLRSHRTRLIQSHRVPNLISPCPKHLGPRSGLEKKISLIVDVEEPIVSIIGE